MDLAQACQREVAELHAFFEQWYNGDLPETEEAFARFERVMAPEFQLILPNGEVFPRDKTILLVQYGHHSACRGHNSNQRMRIWTENHRHRLTVGETALVNYEEWQDKHGVTRGRLSTAMFRRKDGTPNGVEWLHVHETWLGEPA